MSAAAVAIGAGGAIVGSIISSSAASSAADKQADAANQASQLQYQEFEQQQQNQAPWLAAGQSALSQMQNPKFQQGFTMADFQQDPGYQFDLQQGTQAIQRAAAAMGGLQTGGTLKDLSNYAQGMASNEYQNAYNRFNTTNSTNFNRLASLAGLGQTATGQLNQAGMATAQGIGNNMMGAANAQAAGGIAGANAWGGALSSIGNMGSNYAQYNMLSGLMNPSGSSVSMPSGSYASPSNNYGAGTLSMPDLGSSTYSNPNYSLFAGGDF